MTKQGGSMNKRVYLFSEGNRSLKQLLGGKGANLCEMTQLGLPVPPGLTITTDVCRDFYEQYEKLNDKTIGEVFQSLKRIEELTGKKFGDKNNPLLVSVRSGAAISMPGMMDTILNLGLNDETVKTMIKKTDKPKFILDLYRRFIQMFSDVVLGIEKKVFNEIYDNIFLEKKHENYYDMKENDLNKLINEYKNLVKIKIGKEFPQDVKEQLIMAVEAVFKSWNNERAIYYRNINNISHDIGTAVNVQSMVFGNMNKNSGTGVTFTRNPSTGQKGLFGEYLLNAQGEDIVAGICTPKPIEELKSEMENIYDELLRVSKILEKHYKDMQDIEFTIEDGKLYLLQTRNGKRTAKAAVRIVVDMHEEKLISKEQALMRLDLDHIKQILHPIFDPKELEISTKIAKGLPASPGCATGKLYFDSESAIKASQRGEDVILVREETSPEDIKGMIESKGILTIHGGMTSHAAVVARGMGKCCVSGCSSIIIDEKNKLISVENRNYYEGDYISLDGSTGFVYEGKITTVDSKLDNYFETILSWADEYKKLKIEANADNPKDVMMALMFRADGIGLCRTEHMFFGGDRISYMRKMILSSTEDERHKALEKLYEFQLKDFEEILKLMGNKGVKIRLLDPPLHEFLPSNEDEIIELANKFNLSIIDLKRKIKELEEFNPMLGHRGCRLAITYPEIYRMQTKAILQAAVNLLNQGIKVYPKIMIPLIVHDKEIHYIKEIIKNEAKEVFEENNVSIQYQFGTMIEVPRAAITSNRIAKYTDFFSYGTNDLTQMTFGFSRDDSTKFIDQYLTKDIFKNNPFIKVDQEGVGKLIDISSSFAKMVKPDIQIGVCGEHGGEPESIEFFHKIGMETVSCSPYRIPIARLAAAKAAIKLNGEIR